MSYEEESTVQESKGKKGLPGLLDNNELQNKEKDLLYSMNCRKTKVTPPVSEKKTW